MPTSNDNALRRYRRDRKWSQLELARQAGISRAAVSAIEQARLAPSVTSALALARALGCTVEELFGEDRTQAEEAEWAWPARSLPCRYWHAKVGGREWLYPVEPTNLGDIPFDGVWDGQACRILRRSTPEQVLIVATCDPAVGLLACEYARQTPFHLLAFTRSSRSALALVQEGKIHAAGVHLSPSHQAAGNAPIVHGDFGADLSLLRISEWQEGVAYSAHLKLSTAGEAARARLKWVGRELGSGARECLDELLAGRTPPRQLARDHRSVAMAIRCGWADAGVCLRLAGEEAGLGFREVRREAYDLCFPRSSENDHRIRALVDVVRSSHYRRLLDSLPGYESRTTGEVSAC